jgi:hypothetical protein
LKGWAAAHATLEAQFIPLSEKVVEELEPTIKSITLGGVPVLDVRKKG